ncbi:hypothetical protein Tco_1400057 [Tanacetum coccineum]
MEVKLKTKKRKVVVSDSDQEEGGEQDVDLDALLALANAVVIVDSNIPPGGASSSHIPTDIPTGEWDWLLDSPEVMSEFTNGLDSPRLCSYPLFLEGVLMKNKDAAFRDIQMICAEFSSVRVKTQVDWMLLQSSYFNPQVSTSRYVVPAGKVIIIVSTGRLSLVHTGRVLSPGRVK